MSFLPADLNWLENTRVKDMKVQQNRGDAMLCATTRLLLHQLFTCDDVYELDWSLQGFGMLRLKYGSMRVHVWCHELANHIPPHDIHTHPWSFESYIISGSLREALYDFKHPEFGDKETRAIQIVCGEGGGPNQEEPIPLALKEYREVMHRAGTAYYRHKSQFHRVMFTNGAVSVIHRNNSDDQGHAWVIVPEGEEFKSAEPRKPTRLELEQGISAALASMRMECHTRGWDLPL
jgi:hypothetical protein